jgi:hypothetical protein
MSAKQKYQIRHVEPKMNLPEKKAIRCYHELSYVKKYRRDPSQKGAEQPGKLPPKLLQELLGAVCQDRFELNSANAVPSSHFQAIFLLIPKCTGATQYHREKHHFYFHVFITECHPKIL